MKTIKLDGSNYLSTMIPNIFIDQYMCDANGEFVKVYLYIVRHMASSNTISISQIADDLNYTENDIIRSLNYWNEQQVIQVFAPRDS